MKTEKIKLVMQTHDFCNNGGLAGMRLLEAAESELVVIEQEIAIKDEALSLALSYLPAKDGLRTGEPDGDVQLMICNMIKLALSSEPTGKAIVDLWAEGWNACMEEAGRAAIEYDPRCCKISLEDYMVACLDLEEWRTNTDAAA